MKDGNTSPHATRNFAGSRGRYWRPFDARVKYAEATSVRTSQSGFIDGLQSRPSTSSCRTKRSPKPMGSSSPHILQRGCLNGESSYGNGKDPGEAGAPRLGL